MAHNTDDDDNGSYQGPNIDGSAGYNVTTGDNTGYATDDKGYIVDDDSTVATTSGGNIISDAGATITNPETGTGVSLVDGDYVAVGDPYVPTYGISAEHDKVMNDLIASSVAGEIDPSQLVGVKVPLSGAEQGLVDIGWTDNGDGTITSPGGGNYDSDREEMWDWNASDGYEVAGPTEEQSNTLIQTISNILTPNDGEVYVNGVLVDEYESPTSTPYDEVDQSTKDAYKQYGDTLKDAGLLTGGGKQTPDEPANVGNTPILSYDGSNDDPSTKVQVVDVLTNVENYDDLTDDEKTEIATSGLVEGGNDGTLVGSDELIGTASLATNEDGSTYIPYDGYDPHDFSNVTFPGSTDPNSPDYNMSKDMAENGSYYKPLVGSNGEIQYDANGNVILDLSQKKTDDGFLERGLVDADGNKLINAPQIVNTAGVANLLDTGDSSGLVTHSGGNDSCPTPDMRILLEGGTKFAGDIEVGDVVLTAHEDTKKWGKHPVTYKEIKTDNIVKVIFDSAEITCSPTHKVFSSNRDEWVKVSDLQEGDQVVLHETENASTSKWISTEPQGTGDIVVLTVDGAHTYICEGILSHNKKPYGGYETLGGDVLTGPGTNYDPTGGGDLIATVPGTDKVVIVSPDDYDEVITTCPTPDMRITLANGLTKPAGEVEVGDVVYTAHEDTKVWGKHEVTHKSIKQDDIVRVEFDSVTITCSPSHKLFSPTRNDWVAVSDLVAGDEVQTDNGANAKWVSTEPQGTGDIVVLTVADAHTYVCEGILSHNKSPGPGGGDDGGGGPGGGGGDDGGGGGDDDGGGGGPETEEPTDETEIGDTESVFGRAGIGGFYGGYTPATVSDVLVPA